MTKFLILSNLLLICLFTGCASVDGRLYDDLTKDAKRETVLVSGKVYRLGETGICGTAEKEYMTVTHVIPGSPADGKIQVGDILWGMQGRNMWARGGSLAATAWLRLYRVGRDWDWHFYVQVERPSLRNGKGNTVTYDLRMTPAPGNICHYGPTGFFAERHSDHLVVNIIEKGSPADGKLMKGDMILAVDGNPITVDAYDTFTSAIDKAETPEGKGLLRLRVRRIGELPEGSTATKETKKKRKKPSEPTVVEVPQSTTELDVVLTLKVLGRYAKTAPVNCKKTDALITQTADHLVKSRSFGKLNWGLLGLMATGEDKYIKVVRDILHSPKSFAKPPEDPNKLLKGQMYVSWRWGYANLILTEYYLLTGDRYVLPAITQFTRSLAAGQDQAGLWGHQMAKPENGRAHGYGVMNQPSLHIFISLILAEKCGIKDPMVNAAIKRTHNHYKKFMGRGSLPYGNHGAGTHFTNNGTSGSLAVAFALLGNTKGAGFFGAMSAAATEEILLGHGGPRWNILWSGLGANILGPEATAAYSDKVHWLRTSTRKWNGCYTNIKGWGMDPRSNETGCHLLNLCAARRKIHITGKGMANSLWVSKEKAKEIVDAGTIETKTDQALLKRLGSPYPPVRHQAAQELAMQDSQASNEVIDLLASGTRDQKIGAIHAIQALKIENVVDPLLATAMNEKEDLWVRMRAVYALAGVKEAKPRAPKLLAMLVKDKPYDEPYRELDLALGRALFNFYQPDPYATKLDKDLFYQGVMKLLNHKHKTGRATGVRLLKSVPREDLGRVVDKLAYIIEDKDRTYTSYCPGSGRQEALEILYRHGIKESMEYTVETAKQGRMGEQRGRMRLLKTFGGEAKYLIPRIKEILGKNAEPIVKQIEAAPTTKKMIPLKDVKRETK